jgi:sn-glycerol 3-phosphate transport system ATP-binding protein
VGLRPEDVVVADARDRSLTVDIDFVEELGATRLLHGLFAGQTIVLQVPASHAAAGAGKVGFSVPPAAIHVFDAESGTRLN